MPVTVQMLLVPCLQICTWSMVIVARQGPGVMGFGWNLHGYEVLE